MKFYTNVAIRGNRILHRGYENGKPFTEEESFQPVLFINGKNASAWRTLDGRSVEPIVLDSIDSAREFVDKYRDVSSFPIYGNTDYIYQFIGSQYSKEIDYDMSLMRIAYLDIETESEGGFPNIATANERVNVITLVCGHKKYTFALGKVDKSQMPGDVLVNLYENEEQMLGDFMLTWQSLGIDIITGWNVQFFDIPYLVHRMGRLFGESFPKKFSPWGKLKERTVEINGRENIAYEIVGINTLDYYDLYKKFTYVTRESYKLGHIAQVELGETKVSYVEHDNFADFYRKDFTKFVLYNIQDTILVEKLEGKLRLLELAVSLAYSAKVNMQDVFSQVRTWDQIIYHYLNARKIVIPPKKKGKKDVSFEGAYVKDPQVGMHKWVVSFDLDSLYPHLIMQYNLSPETKTKHGLRRSVVPTAILEDGQVASSAISNAIRNGVSLAANGISFSKERRGFLPELMESMYEQRKHYKKLMLEAKARLKNESASMSKEDVHALKNLISKYHNFQLVRKIQLNSAFGAIGNEWFRYYDEEIAEAITLSGQLSVRWVERDLNTYLNKSIGTKDVDYVIAIDTDSVYLNLGPLVDRVFVTDAQKADEEKITKFLDKMCNDALQAIINDSYERLAERMNAYEQKMHMKRESISSKGIFTAKKRYMLNVRMGEENIYLKQPELKIMGIETARSSTPEVVRNSLKEAIAVIMGKDEVALQEFVKKFRERFNLLKPEEIAFPRSCNGLSQYFDPIKIYKKGTPIAVKGALIFNHNLRKNKLGERYQEIREGDKLKFIYLKNPNIIGEKVISFSSKLPTEFELDEFIDHDLQFEKTFLEPLRSILNVIGWNDERVDTLESLFS
jgi:DNA polymerase elongation subunit (family B)